MPLIQISEARIEEIRALATHAQRLMEQQRTITAQAMIDLLAALDAARQVNANMMKDIQRLESEKKELRELIAIRPKDADISAAMASCLTP
jgi:plasmid maintenance system antidote protein VapI